MTGRLLNEDTYSLQLFDSQGQLLSLAKSEIAEYEVVRESAMPSYEGRVSRSELEDLLSYLVSLR